MEGRAPQGQARRETEDTEEEGGGRRGLPSGEGGRKGLMSKDKFIETEEAPKSVSKESRRSACK